MKIVESNSGHVDTILYVKSPAPNAHNALKISIILLITTLCVCVFFCVTFLSSLPQTSVLMNPRVTLIDNYMDDFDQAQLLPLDSPDFLRAITALHGSSTLGQTHTASCTSSLLSTGSYTPHTLLLSS
jgi:hypothetical protein